MQAGEDAGPPQVIVVQNWHEELRRLGGMGEGLPRVGHEAEARGGIGRRPSFSVCAVPSVVLYPPPAWPAFEGRSAGRR